MRITKWYELFFVAVSRDPQQYSLAADEILSDRIEAGLRRLDDLAGDLHVIDWRQLAAEAVRAAASGQPVLVGSRTPPVAPVHPQGSSSTVRGHGCASEVKDVASRRAQTEGR